MELRKHQKECIDEIGINLENNNKALIKMFCGAGKSFIIYHCLLEYSKNLSVVIVPSINLITQFNQDYLLNDIKRDYNKKYFNKDFELMTICSKNELDKKLEKALTFTTDEDKILKFLKKKENKIIIITYQSLKTLIDIIKNKFKKNKFKIDLMCFDEAHHILAKNTKKILFGESDNEYDEHNYDSDDSYDSYDSYNSDSSYEDNSFIDNYVNKTLFFTATPKNSNKIKMYEPHNEITIGDIDYDILDDENTYVGDEIHCGKMVYEYMHINGVNDNILNDFKIRVDLYTENTIESELEAISRTILETGNSRVLTFHSRTGETESEKGSDKKSDVLSFSNEDNKEKFKKCFKKIIKNEFPKLKDKYKNIKFTGITAATKSKEKIKILKEFDECPDDEIFILASCRTIGEGVDTKNANMVCFIDPKQSYVEIIQNIGRICRKNENTKGLATVLIPAYVDVEKYKDCKGDPEKRDIVIRNEMSKTGNFNGILNVLSALRQEDPYMFELCLKYPNVFTNKELKDNFKKNGLELDETEYDKEELFEKFDVKYRNKKTEKENFERLSKKIDKNIIITNKKILEGDVSINKGKDKNIHLVKTENDTYMKVKGVIKGDVKIDRPNRNIKPICHTNKEIKVLWSIDSDIDCDKGIYGGYIKSTIVVNEENWFNMLEKVSEYIDKYDKRPSSEDKNKDIKQMCIWIYHQIQNYKKNMYIMKNKKIKKSWEQFIEKYKKYFLSNEEIWKDNLEQVKKYIDDNNKKPSTHDKNNIVKQLGTWLSTQQKNYTKKENIMKESDIQNKWIKFITDNKYKQYFMSNIEEWKDKLEQVKKYINDNNKRPSDSDKNNKIKQLGIWITRQPKNYTKKEQIMKESEIRILWEQFIEKYKQYFISNIEEWKNNLEQVKKYINDNNKRPSTHDKNTEIKQLGGWIGTQQKKYTKKEYIMKEQDIQNEWVKFISDAKYKKYFMSNIEDWKDKLEQVKKYINDNNKRPSNSDKNSEIKHLAQWISNQQKNYTKKEHIMKDPKIRTNWEEFITEYKEYFPDNPAIQKPSPKSTTIKIKTNVSKESSEQKHKRINSEYQELTKKMSIQKSENTKKMFKEIPDLWNKYHDSRDFSFKGYDNQDEIPVNKIISYLETKKNHKLKILDLGCGRNLIHTHFKDNKKFNITGYDYVSFNGSKEADISNLPEEDESIKICIYSQSLMGSNWKDYLTEGRRVLEYNGEMIISESIERYDIIKKYLEELGMHIIKDDYIEKNRWFYIYAIKQ